jgi:hypothetical protein
VSDSPASASFSERVGSRRFEQPIPAHRAAGVGDDKRFRDQVRHAIDDLHRREFVIRHDYAHDL